MDSELNIYILQFRIVSHNNIIVVAKVVLLFPASVLVQKIDYLNDSKINSNQSSFRRQGHCTRLVPHK